MSRDSLNPTLHLAHTGIPEMVGKAEVIGLGKSKELGQGNFAIAFAISEQKQQDSGERRRWRIIKETHLGTGNSNLVTEATILARTGQTWGGVELNYDKQSSKVTEVVLDLGGESLREVTRKVREPDKLAPYQQGTAMAMVWALTSAHKNGCVVIDVKTDAVLIDNAGKNIALKYNYLDFGGGAILSLDEEKITGVQDKIVEIENYCGYLRVLNEEMVDLNEVVQWSRNLLAPGQPVNAYLDHRVAKAIAKMNPEWNSDRLQLIAQVRDKKVDSQLLERVKSGWKSKMDLIEKYAQGTPGSVASEITAELARAMGFADPDCSSTEWFPVAPTILGASYEGSATNQETSDWLRKFSRKISDRLSLRSDDNLIQELETRVLSVTECFWRLVKEDWRLVFHEVSQMSEYNKSNPGMISNYMKSRLDQINAAIDKGIKTEGDVEKIQQLEQSIVELLR